jgi:hypothetical protein
MKQSFGFTVLLLAGQVAVADVIWEQPAPSTPAVAFVAQVFPDLPRYSTYQFDDFSISQDMFIDRLTVRGIDRAAAPPSDAGQAEISALPQLWPDLGVVGEPAPRQGRPEYNNGVIAEIWDALPGPVYQGAKVMESVSGGEDLGTGTLTFDFGSQPLSAGHYWITVYVVRPYEPGGEWLWQSTPQVRSSEHYTYNPGGGYGIGDQPVPASKTPASRGRGKSDLVFTLEGHPQITEYEPLPVPQF